MKKHSFSLWTLIISIIASAAVTLSLTLIFVPNTLTSKDISGITAKLSEMDKLAKANFYSDIDAQNLSDFVCAGYAAGLDDRYTAYYSAEQNRQLQISNSGDSVGIGVSVAKHPDSGEITVIEVTKGSPAQTAGFKSGDIIVSVDGKDAAELGFEDTVLAIRGDIGTTVKITIERDKEEKTLTVTRNQFAAQSVTYELIEKVGYVKLSSFNETTPDQFNQAIDELVKSGATSFIFDVRSNPGGLLTSVEEVLDRILPKGTIISAEYKNSSEKVLYTSDANELDMPIAVLTDGDTASAAELFTAAIRDFEKGRIYGEKTYGKGVMQSTYTLSDGSAFKMTVASFYPPSGESFNEKGIEPDVKITPSEHEKTYKYFISKEEDSVLSAALKELSK